jgi:hypothetical protein
MPFNTIKAINIDHKNVSKSKELELEGGETSVDELPNDENITKYMTIIMRTVPIAYGLELN